MAEERESRTDMLSSFEQKDRSRKEEADTTDAPHGQSQCQWVHLRKNGFNCVTLKVSDPFLQVNSNWQRDKPIAAAECGRTAFLQVFLLRIDRPDVMLFACDISCGIHTG